MGDGKSVAIVLAAGRGTRMQSSVQKQYMEIGDKPVLYYTLRAFEESDVDSIILVVGQGEITYCMQQIVQRYAFAKIEHVIEGGLERYHSVNYALQSVSDRYDKVLIHDGARPFIEVSMIQEMLRQLDEEPACIFAVPVKDTIKTTNQEGFVEKTLERSLLWMIQTPQGFERKLILEAYQRLMEEEGSARNVTDDSMVVEQYTKSRVKVLTGSYRNIKITTPEDLAVAWHYLQQS